jgi:osmotically-inducible protein OsmY
MNSSIGVTVINRRVYLSGTANSSDQLARVNEISFSVPGAVAVSNGLQLSALGKYAPTRNGLRTRSY